MYRQVSCAPIVSLYAFRPLADDGSNLVLGRALTRVPIRIIPRREESDYSDSL